MPSAALGRSNVVNCSECVESTLLPEVVASDFNFALESSVESLQATVLLKELRNALPA